MILLDINACAIAVSFPESVEDHLREIFSNFPAVDGHAPTETVEVIAGANSGYRLRCRDFFLTEEISAEDVPAALCNQIESILAAVSRDTVVQAGAIRSGESSIMILGPAGSGKSAMTAWLIENGFQYLADHFVSLASTYASANGSPTAISPLPMPLRLTEPRRQSTQIGKECLVHRSGSTDFLAIPDAKRTIDRIEHCKLILYPRLRPRSGLEFLPLNTTETRFLLMQALHPIQGAATNHTARTKSFSEAVPAVAVCFDDHASLAGQLDRFIAEFLKQEPDRYLSENFCKSWLMFGTGKVAPKQSSLKVPRRIWPRGRKPKLSIGMATYDDFDGVYFTIQSLRLHHSEIDDDVEYIVIDNYPDGPCGKSLRDLEDSIPNLRYVPENTEVSSAIRDHLFQYAASDYILILDCHVLLAPGSVARLIDYFEQNPDTRDLLQGPMIWDEMDKVATHLAPRWGDGFFGRPEEDRRGVNPDSPPFPVNMQGLGLYACRRDVWPGFSPRFRGWGGEEGYIHEKFRQRGARTLCLPFLRWLHRFQRPYGVPYKFNWDDRIHNYLVGAYELGYTPDDAVRHFREIIPDNADRIIASVQAEIEEYKRQDMEALKAARA